MDLLGYLEKATLTSDQLQTYGGILSAEQLSEFIRVAMTPTVILKEATRHQSKSRNFEVPSVSLSSRVLRAGTEGSRLADADRVVPSTGLVTLSTQLFRGEMPVSDQVFWDNIEQEGFADTLANMLAEAIGRDVEEIAIKSDTDRTASEDQTLDKFDGIIKTLQGLPSGQKVNATSITTYEALFSDMLSAMPSYYRTNPDRLRLYVPLAHLDGYQSSLAGRSTTLGDQAVVDDMAVRIAYRGIRTVGVPLLSGTDTINTASIDYGTFAFLIDPKNIFLGIHNDVRIERWRDPREGVTSFVATICFDVKLADPNAAVLAYNVPASLS